MASITPRQLRAARLNATSLAPSGRSGSAELVCRLLAMQGQDFPSACWGIGVRSGGTLTDVFSAFDDGSLVRSWPLRGTLHVVAAADLGWMLAITAPRQLRAARKREADLGLDEAVFESARELAVTALSGDTALDRAQFTSALAEAGIRVDGQRAYHLIWRLALEGRIVWGPIRGSRQLLVLSAGWLPNVPAVARDEALGRFLARYLTGHGPASLADFAWWAGLTKSDAATAHAVLRHRLTPVTCDGEDLWALDDARFPARPASAVRLLPGFDEYLLGYRDRTQVLAPEHAAAVAPGGNGVFLPMLVSGGEIVGVWRRTVSRAGVSVQLRPFRPLASRELRSAGVASARFARFLGLPRIGDLDVVTNVQTH